MKRLTRYCMIVLLVLLPFLATAAFVTWTTATSPGSRWLLKSIPSLTGVAFSAGTIEGTIADRLVLTGVRLVLDQQRVEIDRAELHWKPLLLLAGTVGFKEITLSGVRIQDDAPHDGKPPVLEWPHAPQRAQLLNAVIERLQVTGLNYQRLEEIILSDASLTTFVSWEDGTLTLKKLLAKAATGRVNGSISAGLVHPSLAADLTITAFEPMAEMDQLRLRLQPGKRDGDETLAATVMLEGAMGSKKLLELSGDIGMTDKVFNLRRLRLDKTGQKGEITAAGTLAFQGSEPLLELLIGVKSLDLEPQINTATKLSGTITFRGTVNGYGGSLKLNNQGDGWQTLAVDATYEGNGNGLKLSPVSASVLDGSLAGNLHFDWHNGFAVDGEINGSNLNPARFDPDWVGLVNFTASGNFRQNIDGETTGKIRGVLLDSRLHGHKLTGEVQADIAGNNLLLSRLTLRGKGFDLQGTGDLTKRLAFDVRITDVSRLVPKATGSIRAGGWARWRDHRLSGACSGTGQKLAFAGTRIEAANLDARLNEGTGYPFKISATLLGTSHENYGVDAIKLSSQGTLQHHEINATLNSGRASARLAVTAGYDAGVWRGELSGLTGNDGVGPWTMDQPTRFSVSSKQLTLTSTRLTSGAAENLEVAVDLALEPLTGEVHTQWSNLDMARVNPFLKKGQISGKSRGTLRLNLLDGRRVNVAGNASIIGAYSDQGIRTPVMKGLITVSGNEQGLHANMEIHTADGGKMEGNFFSPAPLALELPDSGKLTVELTDVDVALLTPWLPDGVRLKGRFSGQANGNLLPGQHFVLDGSALLSKASFLSKNPEGEFNIALTSAKASWNWRGDSLGGAIDVVMAEYGHARATFRLPIPAALPLVITPDGGIRAKLVGQAREKGLITAMFPKVVQESFGELNVDISLGGTWEQPGISGKLKLAGAGAYLPTAGIHLKDVELAARLEKNLIRIDSFKAVSGPGYLDGTALITLKGRQITAYSGTIGGENFQTVHLPELQVLVTPKLTFAGNSHKLTLRGDLLLPQVQITTDQSRNVITPSSDVILEGREPLTSHGDLPLLDAKIRVRLGEKVFVKTGGIDAQLGGTVDLSFNRLENITSAGEIKVIKGRFQTYGVNLEIVRGRLFFAGVPMDSPTLDFLALRTIGDVQAGVTVAGTLRRPVTRLYSQPAMPDVDILAYIVLGHPLGSSGEQAGIMAQAAGALLTSSQAAVVQQQIKNYLGLSTLDIQSGVGVGGGASTSTYKPLQSAAVESRQPGVSETILTVGKYLTPQLYVSYGKSLFSSSNLFRLRYDIYKKWQIETQTGTESGADLFYKLEFK